MEPDQAVEWAESLAATLAHEDARPVLVAVDGTAGAWDALEWAAAEAAARGCPLRIFHALSRPVVLDPFGTVWTYRDAAADQESSELLLLQAEFRAREVAHDLRVTTHQEYGPIVPTLLRHEHHSSLIVLDQGHSRGLGGAIAEPPAARVARRAHCPVALVPPAAERPPGPSPSRVVVGLGADRDQRVLLGLAFQAARRRGVGITALHARAADDRGARSTRATADPGNRHPFHGLVPWRAAFPDVDVVERLVTASPGDALVEASAGAALLMIGPRGNRRLNRRPLASTTRSLMRSAACPLTVVPAKSQV